MSCQGDPTCQEVFDHLCELVDAEAFDTMAIEDEGGDDARGAGDPAEVLDARARALLAAHARGCPHCSDALDAERHLRALLRRCCAEQDHAPESLRVRVISSTTMVWHG